MQPVQLALLAQLVQQVPLVLADLLAPKVLLVLAVPQVSPVLQEVLSVPLASLVQAALKVLLAVPLVQLAPQEQLVVPLDPQVS